MARMTTTRQAVRFWTKVQFSEGCWLWTGGKRRGYGNFAVDPTRRRNGQAHRFAYEELVGPILTELAKVAA